MSSSYAPLNDDVPSSTMSSPFHTSTTMLPHTLTQSHELLKRAHVYIQQLESNQHYYKQEIQALKSQQDPLHHSFQHTHSLRSSAIDQDEISLKERRLGNGMEISMEKSSLSNDNSVENMENVSPDAYYATPAWKFLIKRLPWYIIHSYIHIYI